MPDPRTFLPTLPARAADALIGAFAMWQALALLCVYGGLSFDTLTLLSPLAVLAGLLPLWTRPEEVAPADEPAPPPVPWASLAALLVACAGAWAARGSLGLFGATLAMVPLGLVLWNPRQPLERGHPTSLRATGADAAALFGVALAAMAVTTWVKQTDPDDGYYLSAVYGHLAYPTLPVLSFDTIHGDPTVPIQQIIHRPQTFEVFVAWVCRVLGTDPADAYWIGVPALFAAASALAHWVLAKAFAPRLAWLATPLGFALLCTWGDGRDTLGKYAFCRLYQGKAVFVTVFAPLVLYAAYRYTTEPSPRSWVRLAAAQLAATTFTSTALVMAPLGAGLAVLAGAGTRPERGRVALAGWASSVPVLLALGAMAWELEAGGGLRSDGQLESTTTSLGPHLAGPVLLGLVLGALALRHLGSPGAVFLARYGVVALLLVLNGVTPSLLGARFADLLNWRSFWAVPLPAILAVGLAGACVSAVTHPKRDAVLGVVALGVLAVFATGTWSVSGRGVGHGWAEHKVNARLVRVADQIVARTRPDDVVAAPPLLGQYIVLRPVRPRMVGLWNRWTTNLGRYWGPEETDRRLRVVKYVRGHDNGPPPFADLDALCVRVLVTDPEVRRKPRGLEGLGRHGFSERKVGTYTVWDRPRASLPAPCR
ncbi:MAG: DUF6077 domain-containing protein [Myxococcota bacterium]